MTEPDERSDLPALIAGAQGGDRGAFAHLASRVRDAVRGWAEAMTGDADDAEDVTQDVLILVQRRLPQFENRSRFTTWLYRITHNVAVDRRRTATRRAARLEAAEPAVSQVVQEERLDDEALTSLVLRYFDELPRRQREVFELADIRGLSAQEIAERLGMRAVTVRANLFKARRTIRERMIADHPRLVEEYRS